MIVRILVPGSPGEVYACKGVVPDGHYYLLTEVQDRGVTIPTVHVHRGTTTTIIIEESTED